MLVDLLESIKLSSLNIIIITKLILSLVKVVNETNNNINHDLIFMLVYSSMLPLFSCLSCFDIPLLPFI